MQLLYIRYKDGRLFLLLSLGERNGKYCGIATDAISDGEREKIIKQAGRLTGLSLERKIEWLRVHCPIAFRTGFREIYTRNATVVSRHPIGTRI